MQHKVTIDIGGKPVPYRELIKGTLFHRINRKSDENVYMKTGTRAFSLKTGEEFSNDQECEVVPIPFGTKITLVVGEKE